VINWANGFKTQLDAQPDPTCLILDGLKNLAATPFYALPPPIPLCNADSPCCPYAATNRSYGLTTNGDSCGSPFTEEVVARKATAWDPHGSLFTWVRAVAWWLRGTLVGRRFTKVAAAWNLRVAATVTGGPCRPPVTVQERPQGAASTRETATMLLYPAALPRLVTKIWPKMGRPSRWQNSTQIK